MIIHQLNYQNNTITKNLNQNKMSTTFGIPRQPIDIELGDKDGVFYYINTDIFEKVWFRSMGSILV